MSFPKELTALRQWICWRLEPDPKSDKPRKVPYDPKTGRKASSTNPESWASLAEAQAARAKYLFTGIGFVFTAECGIVGVDIDHCRNEDGSFSDVAKAILEKAQSYTEVSPSGSGLHIFLRGTMPGKGNKNSTSGVEMYSVARYFTMTGKHLEGTPEGIVDGTTILPWIHENYIAKKTEKRNKARKPVRTLTMPDEQVLEKARASQNGDDFSALWDGVWEGKFGSQSEADLSLCCSLAFWTGKNKEQMDRLFRKSKLFREKWDKVHHANGATYGEETLDQAIARTENVYTPGGDLGIYESNGRYIRERGENIYALTNFIVRPLDMVMAEEETQMTCDLVTMYGEVFHMSFMTSDFSSSQRFKSVLNKRTISLSYMGNDNDLEILKAYIAGLPWQRRIGYTATGIFERDNRWVFVHTGGAMAANGEEIDDMLQIPKSVSIETNILDYQPISTQHMIELGGPLLRYNEAAKTVTVLAWCAGCFVKEMLRTKGIKYPHLFLIGEAGSGKSTTMEKIVLPIFGRERIVASPQITTFTIMKDASSSNVFPQALDEFKPSKIEKNRLATLLNHMRDSFDGHDGVRGRADQTQVSYTLLAPLVVAGEESPAEPSIRERSMELLFSKRDLKDSESRVAFGKVKMMSKHLTEMGRALLDTALTVNTETALRWYDEAVEAFKDSMAHRVVNNLACGMVGIRLLETMLNRMGLEWSQVFSITIPACAKYMEYAAVEYLLDGRETNQSIVEESLEVIDRMGLTCDECRMLSDDLVALHFKSFYDRFTQYRRDHAIIGECLPYAQFMKQLRKADIYIETKNVRLGEEVRKCIILNYAVLQQRCDIDGFIHSQVEPLLGVT
jgi:putative DNA primase/helicase